MSKIDKLIREGLLSVLTWLGKPSGMICFSIIRIGSFKSNEWLWWHIIKKGDVYCCLLSSNHKFGQSQPPYACSSVAPNDGLSLDIALKRRPLRPDQHGIRSNFSIFCTIRWLLFDVVVVDDFDNVRSWCDDDRRRACCFCGLTSCRLCVDSIFCPLLLINIPRTTSWRLCANDCPPYRF